MIKRILVTGATGNIGSLVVNGLLQKGAEVRVFVRDRSKAISLFGDKVEIFEGDFSNQNALNEAASGIDAMLAITPPNPDAVIQGEALLKAALNSGSPHYVRISAIGAASNAPTENGRLHFQSDEALKNSGLPYTILRPHFFMQNLFMSVDTIKSEGNMYMGMGEGKLGLIDVRDIVDCCEEILLNRSHIGKTYTPTGPESISFSEIAKVMSKSLGKQVNYIPVPIEAVGEAILNAGWGEWGAQVMMDYSKAYSEGWGDFVNDDVEAITGHKSRSFQEFFDEVMSFAVKN